MCRTWVQDSSRPLLRSWRVLRCSLPRLGGKGWERLSACSWLEDLFLKAERRGGEVLRPGKSLTTFPWVRAMTLSKTKPVPQTMPARLFCPSLHTCGRDDIFFIIIYFKGGSSKTTQKHQQKGSLDAVPWKEKKTGGQNGGLLIPGGVLMTSHWNVCSLSLLTLYIWGWHTASVCMFSCALRSCKDYGQLFFKRNVGIGEN